MENASKALIIAGAILLSILLISLGIMIFNEAQSVIDGSGMSNAELEAFNQRFTKYEGEKRGSIIRSMIQEVLANNNGDDINDQRMISINEDNFGISAAAGDTDVVSLVAGKDQQPRYGSKFLNTKTYKVEVLYKDGRAAVIIVNPK